MTVTPEEPARLVRYYFTLPEPLAVPDGYSWHETYDHAPGNGIQKFVNLTFTQMSGASRQQAIMVATLESLNRAKGETGNPGASDAEDLTGQYTTVIATTFHYANQEIVSEWISPQDVPAEHDPLNRCIEAISKFIRCYRTAFEAPCAVPTYEKIGPLVPFETGKFSAFSSNEEHAGFQISEWDAGGTIMLHHANFSDFPSGIEIAPEHEDRLLYFRRMLDQGNPLFLWKERYVEARGALYKEGNYGAAVTLSNTASEVLLDGLLGLLYWELGRKPEEVATIFSEGRLARRVKSNFSELLGGNWSLDGAGPISDWFHKCYRLRHRVVHGGYSPSRLEAEVAAQSALALSSYCWERLAERRKKFPRTAMMAISEEGLRKRHKWCGSMQKFMSEVAPREPSWLDAAQAWRQEMHAALLADK
ncbi:hypothetical protein [Streptomyces globisporus]|uniref:hypothetical protein n=1 Tax=Streptomyces globisporus TaxID=1908 RepID=UPI00369ABC81